MSDVMLSTLHPSSLFMFIICLCNKGCGCALSSGDKEIELLRPNYLAQAAQPVGGLVSRYSAGPCIHT